MASPSTLWIHSGLGVAAGPERLDGAAPAAGGDEDRLVVAGPDVEPEGRAGAVHDRLPGRRLGRRGVEDDEAALTGEVEEAPGHHDHASRPG